ncbi:MAG: 1-(5-phosphoribosyl)-5-[(5-phosphoribosylamino)methylideneamino]imidazole-4-carboxamide isomerase [Peptococcia bacterium]
MLVIPAIDLRDGRCVRLVQGELNSETVYSDEPVEMALRWEAMGAQCLHIVDLDGAFKGEPQNLEIISEIVQNIKIPIQVGGGIRSLSAVEKLLDIGVERVILGTAAILNPDLVAQCTQKYGERILVGIDGKNGLVAIEGWEATVEMQVEEFARTVAELGVREVVFTDTRRDGTLKGPNLEATKNLALNSGLKVIASGGVSSLEDLIAIKELKPYGVAGIIVGKALYTEAICLQEAIALMEG